MKIENVYACTLYKSTLILDVKSPNAQTLNENVDKAVLPNRRYEFS